MKLFARECRKLRWRILQVVVMLVAVGFAWAQGAQPRLTVALIGTDQFQIVITNGSSSVNYELYRTSVLDDPIHYPFTLDTIGSLGQTNFLASFGAETSGFFYVAEGSDWDGDGIPNFIDAQPSSTNAGALFITIDSPANGANVQ